MNISLHGEKIRMRQQFMYFIPVGCDLAHIYMNPMYTVYILEILLRTCYYDIPVDDDCVPNKLNLK